MRAGNLRSMVWAVTAAGVGLATGCTQTRQLGQADWGALRGDERIVVVTASGVRHELKEFRFFTTGLVGQGEQGEIEIPHERPNAASVLAKIKLSPARGGAHVDAGSVRCVDQADGDIVLEGEQQGFRRRLDPVRDFE